MSDDNKGPQPESGPMDEPTANWYMQYTGGQFGAFKRGEQWYLCSPDPEETGGEPIAAAEPAPQADPAAVRDPAGS
jgi:hypothetical protein